MTRIKKLLIISSLLFFFLAMHFNVNAQLKEDDVYDGALSFGLYHSFNFTTVVGNFPELKTLSVKQETNLAAPRFTFDIGMTMDYRINRKTSIQVDALFTYNGGHFVRTRTIYNEVGKIEEQEYFTYSTSYMQLPMAFVFYPKDQIYFSGGAYVGALIHSQRYHHWYNSTSSTPIRDVNPFDYGLVFGMGFNTSYVKIGFQYSYGLSSIVNDPSYDLHHSDYKMVVRWKFASDVRKRKRGY